MKKIILIILVTILHSCSKDSANNLEKPKPEKKKVIPKIYSFKKNNKSSVDFYQMRVLIDMHTLLERDAKNSLYFGVSSKNMEDKFKNLKEPFKYNQGILRIFNASETLNKEKSLNIYDVLSSSKKNSKNSEQVRLKILNFFKEIEKISKVRLNAASKGKPGYIFYGKDYSKRLVNSSGIETTQEMTKSIMGAFQLDQIINHYLGSEQLNSDNTKNIAGKNYTQMEHNWDRAFALTGLPTDSELNYLEGTSDEKARYARFWSEYIYRVDKTPAGRNIKEDIYNAFILGRQAIVDNNYKERDAQAKKIKSLLAKVCAIRTAYYLNQGVLYLKDEDLDRRGDAAHVISEGLGFAYSLRFTTKRLNYDFEIKEIKSNGGIWDKKRVIKKVQNLINKIAKEYSITISDL